MSALSCVRRRTPVPVFDQIKQAPAPELLAEIDPWMRRMKSLKQDTAFAVLAANLSPQGFIDPKAAIWFIMSEYGCC